MASLPPAFVGIATDDQTNPVVPLVFLDWAVGLPLAFDRNQEPEWPMPDFEKYEKVLLICKVAPFEEKVNDILDRISKNKGSLDYRLHGEGSPPTNEPAK